MLLSKQPNKIFSKDFDLLLDALKRNEYFAFSRFSDGEMWIMQNREFSLGPYSIYNNYTEEDYKIFNPSQESHQHARQALINAYLYRQDNYFCGLSCRCCVGNADFQWMFLNSRKDSDELTWANLLINANYVRFIQEFIPLFNTKSIILIARHNAEINYLSFQIKQFFGITNNAMVTGLETANQLYQYMADNKIQDHILLFGAGALSNIIIHNLFIHYPKNFYIDIGSALNPFLNLDIARGYLISGIKKLNIPITDKQKKSMELCKSHGYNERVCIW